MVSLDRAAQFPPTCPIALAIDPSDTSVLA